MLSEINPDDSLIALGFQNILVLLDMDNSVYFDYSTDSKVCFYSGISQRPDDVITAMQFINDYRLIVGTSLGHLYM